MFNVEINQTTNSFVVINTDNDNETIVIASGKFALDVGDRSLLVLVTHITIPSINNCLLGKFITDILSYMGKYFNARVYLRLPMFDHQLNVDKWPVEKQMNSAMAVQIADVCYDDSNTIRFNQEKCLLVTDKQTILNYSEQLAEMLNSNAYWINNLSSEDIKKRVDSAKRVVMVLDKVNDIPCGFGRLFMMITDSELNYTMGYVDDVVVDSQHQSQGLGWTINNYLTGIKKEGINGTLCLVCALEGSGHISAPKIYKNSGFEFINKLNQSLAIFIDEQHIPSN